MEDLKEFDDMIQTITNKHTKTVWDPNPSQLTCCIVEPRQHHCLAGVLNNMANVYANGNVGLKIYYSQKNAKQLKEIIKDWDNVQLVRLHNSNLRIDQYNQLLTSKQFWDSFKSTHALIFQCDSLIFRKIPDIYFDFDYVGAPWSNIPKLQKTRARGNGCGNGGFSLRRVDKMRWIARQRLPTGHSEDLWFSKFKMHLPDEDLQKAFSCEECYYENPVGCHKPYRMDRTKYAEFKNSMKSWLGIVDDTEEKIVSHTI